MECWTAAEHSYMHNYDTLNVLTYVCRNFTIAMALHRDTCSPPPLQSYFHVIDYSSLSQETYCPCQIQTLLNSFFSVVASL